MDQQLSFSDASYTDKKKTTRKERFFERDGCGVALGRPAATDPAETIPSRVKGVVRFRRR